ncbi:HXXXD-type acyl-transferase family protein [Rhynchospora pubera]|uniref:HXXXD-type acyl-transferase family protein n=1 Tax=Rhynchospora pubera TaxID=906938 RepID=A0AAV8G3M9_9POAL|nr:HXXXD-type acyl-transferase family protein [Rhynchospora pubera]
MAKVTILSTETIKPSQPTTNSFPSIPLSLLDQLAPPIYTHILFFYSTYLPEIPEKLKSSLSRSLNYFYPFAGRIREIGKGKLHVECNGEGAEFVEAQVTGATTESIRHGPVVEIFNELLPIKKSLFDFRESGPLLAVQINVLDGGGFILGVSISHFIADGASLSMFLNWWSRTASGFAENLSPAPLLPRFDCDAVFPPEEMPHITIHKRSSEDSGSNQDVAMRCFSINSKAMETLKQVGGTTTQSTRVEAVSALIWRCIKRVQARNRLSISHCVNFRKRMAPVLSNESIGNMWINVEIPDLGIETESTGGIEQSIRRAVQGVDENFVRMKAQEMWDVREGKEQRAKGIEGVETVEWIFTSWCRMGWYDCDFGFEAPDWVACGITAMKNVCMLIDAKDGQGMEVWLWMAMEEMERIESDSEFRLFVTSSFGESINRISEY